MKNRISYKIKKDTTVACYLYSKLFSDLSADSCYDNVLVCYEGLTVNRSKPPITERRNNNKQ